MHDGSLATLEDVVTFYDGGGRANPSLDPEIRPLRLSDEERRQLVAFLRTLSGELRYGGGSVR
jgi:cytochrome c peroxidase